MLYAAHNNQHYEDQNKNIAFNLRQFNIVSRTGTWDYCRDYSRKMFVQVAVHYLRTPNDGQWLRAYWLHGIMPPQVLNPGQVAVPGTDMAGVGYAIAVLPAANAVGGAEITSSRLDWNGKSYYGFLVWYNRFNHQGEQNWAVAGAGEPAPLVW